MKRYLFFLIILMIMAVSVNFTNQWFLVPVALAFLALLDLQVFRILLKWKFLLFLAILVFGVPLFAGTKDKSFLGIPYSFEIFQMSVEMAHRSVIILMSVKMFTNRISVDQMARAMQRIRLRQFSQVFALALKVLPEIRVITVNTFKEYRTRERRQNFIADAFHWLVKLMVRIIHYANTLQLEKHDDVV